MLREPGPRILSFYRYVKRTDHHPLYPVTNETDIAVSLDIDGSGVAEIATGIGFLDHMLDHIGRHGLFDLKVGARGDLHVEEAGRRATDAPFAQ